MKTNLGVLEPTSLSIAIDDNATVATSTLTSADTGAFTDGKVVVLDEITYRFKTVPDQAYDIFIGASADATLTSLVKAINLTGEAGVDYFEGTEIHPTCVAAAVASHATVVTSKVAAYASNTIVTTTDEAKLSWTGSTLSGGGSTIGTYTFNGEGGIARRFTTVCPQFAGTPTYTLSILDAESNVLYVSGNLTENATTQTTLEILLAGTDTIKITTSAKVEETLPVKVIIR